MVLQRDTRIPDTLVTQITTNETSIAKLEYFKFFPNDDQSYSQVSGNAFLCPPGFYKYKLWYGDGMEGSLNNTYGVRIFLPTTTNLANGTEVSLSTLHNYNSSSSTSVMFVNFTTASGQPSGRRLIDNSTEYTIGNAQTESSYVEGFATSSGTARQESHFTYVLSEDAWIFRVDSY